MWLISLFFFCFSANAWLPSLINNKSNNVDVQWEQVKQMQYLYEGRHEQKVKAHQAKKTLIRSGDISSLPAQQLLVTFLSNKLLQSEAEALLKRQSRASFRFQRTLLYKETQIDLWNIFKELGLGHKSAYRVLRTTPLHPEMQIKLISALYSSQWQKPARFILMGHGLSARSQDMLIDMLEVPDKHQVDMAENILIRRDGPLTVSAQKALIKNQLFDPTDPEKRKRARSILTGTQLGWQTIITLRRAGSQAPLPIKQENQVFIEELLANSPTPRLLKSTVKRCVLAFKK